MANQMIGGRMFNRLAEPTMSNAELIRSGGNVSGIQRTATRANPVVPVKTEPDIATNINRTPLNFDLYGTGGTTQARGAFDLGGTTTDPYAISRNETPTIQRGSGLSWMDAQAQYPGISYTQWKDSNPSGSATGTTGSPTLDLAMQQAADAERELGIAQRKSEEELQAAYSDIDAEQRSIFAPRYAQLEREGDRAQETQRRGFSFRGFGKSSRAIEEEERLNEMVRAESAALAAEESAAIRLQRAAARGASDAELEALQSQYNNAQLNVSQLQEARAKEEEGLTAASIAAGQAAEKDRLDRRIAALEAAGLVEDPDTGERVATLKGRAQALDESIKLSQQGINEGRYAMDQAKFPLEYAKLEADLAKINRSLLGGTGGGGGTGIGGGTIGADGNITGLDPKLLAAADAFYRNADGDVQLALENIGGLSLSADEERDLASYVQTLDLASITSAETGLQAIPNFQNGSIDFIAPDTSSDGRGGLAEFFIPNPENVGAMGLGDKIKAASERRKEGVSSFFENFDMTK